MWNSELSLSDKGEKQRISASAGVASQRIGCQGAVCSKQNFRSRWMTERLLPSKYSTISTTPLHGFQPFGRKINTQIADPVD